MIECIPSWVLGTGGGRGGKFEAVCRELRLKFKKQEETKTDGGRRGEEESRALLGDQHSALYVTVQNCSLAINSFLSGLSPSTQPASYG